MGNILVEGGNKLRSLVGLVFLAILLVYAAKAEPDLLSGTWKSRGYGYVFEVHGSHLQAFEITSETCVLGFTAKLQNAVLAGRERTFKSSDGDVFFFRTGSDTQRLLHFEGAASDVVLDRLTRLPAVCEEPTANIPSGNFNVFARTFEEQYISFDIKHADWKKIVAGYRSMVTAETTPNQLFDIFEAMIKPFGDAHTGIEARNLKREFEGFRPGGYQLTEGKSEKKFRKIEMPALFAIGRRLYLDGPMKSLCNSQLQYAHIGKTTGYLRILAEGDYIKHGGPAGELAALEKALDDVFSDPDLRALILDLRINFGGSDQLGLAIASRLTAGEYLAFTKYARANSGDRDQWTEGQASFVRPTARPSFYGPVIELIGPLTISAGETFTQALIGRKPHVTRIGENTQGVFSDVLGRRLPNKWTFALPNEVFRTAEGTAFDGAGIPPDVQAPVYDVADVAAGKDPALEMAIKILAKR